MSEFANFLACDETSEVHLVLFSGEDIFFPISKEVSIHFQYRCNTRAPMRIFRAYKYLRKTFKKIKPEVVLSFGSMYNAFVLLAAIGLDLRVYVSDRSNPYRNTQLKLRRDLIKRHDGPLHYFLKRWLYKKAAGIIVQTEAARQIEMSFSRHPNIILFPNPARRIKGRHSRCRDKIILNVGRFVDTKNQLELVEVFSDVRFDDWRLIFLGEGPTRSIVERQVKVLNLEEFVSFMGNVSDVDEFLMRSEIFAFPSLSEGFPNALLEGMSAGLACVAYDCVAGPNELIDDGVNGFLAPLGDRRCFAERLSRLMSDETLRKLFQASASASLNKYEMSRVFSELKRELIGL